VIRPAGPASVKAKTLEALQHLNWARGQSVKIKLLQVEKKPDNARESAIQESILAAVSFAEAIALPKGGDSRRPSPC
jgi:hypothetical protein